MRSAPALSRNLKFHGIPIAPRLSPHNFYALVPCRHLYRALILLIYTERVLPRHRAFCTHPESNSYHIHVQTICTNPENDLSHPPLNTNAKDVTVFSPAHINRERGHPSLGNYVFLETWKHLN